MPDGTAAPVQLMTFAAPLEGRAFFVMATPAFWEQAGVDSEHVGRDRMLTAVFLHEFAHTRQIQGQRVLDPIEQGWKFPQELTDNVVQQRFGDDPDYRAAYERERDLLYRAASAESLTETRAVAAEALRELETRRRKWFVGENEVFRTLDDVFLSFEGAGQWTGFAWLADGRGGGVTREAAINGMRGSRRWWTQDEGLALFLVLERLLPTWPSLVFAVQSLGARDLLAKAIAQ
jgi:hypothetical protein